MKPSRIILFYTKSTISLFEFYFYVANNDITFFNKYRQFEFWFDNITI